MSDEPSIQDTPRRRVGVGMMIAGLVAWVAMMVLIVYRNTTTGEVPTRTFMIATFLCWGVFFVGKSILKFDNNKLEPKTPPTE
ncbi:hypothetical protein IT570_08490 [Candidatus Sumerlaeota bacterium]|nr:hypothetical protein [Candidatus Sumerlaeota bacterium]